ncbi:hypothetical protein PDIG_71420 [Penicillium digitatum PHI26]|uniref:Uncharacterized protein n=2 Tax=Penicillium digitatum TaxID=36651 RepID=K9FHP7_PEND2|nr:hypothetical protein PDIP_80720 [Penicillium digitatum Pd1]EKV06042.1 hypothetical protein PDIP_80720 [Penicillium digitatum Pd1]EKV07712.1 hypothetical protein PDIG_71420 [Penicillium digitatum PHI26]
MPLEAFNAKPQLNSCIRQSSHGIEISGDAV